MRIEDTDKERSTKEFEKNILDGLSWLGLSWDGEILYQSKRLEIYKQKALELVNNGLAVEKDGAIILQAKKALEQLKIPFEQIKAFVGWKGEKPRESSVAYFLKNIGDDLIHGKISGALSDTILLRSDGTPTFHLAVVIDDQEMGITDVIRGDDHLSNTPLHIVLQKALGYKTPKYAHIPMILGSDHSKLSKRHGATSVLEYKDQGYLPEALVNFMALLGWNPKDEREVFTLEELVEEFDLKNVNKAGAVFDIEKLNWMNGEYLKVESRKSKVESRKSKVESLKDFGVEELSQGELELIGRGGYKTLKEAAQYIIQLRKTPEYNPELLVFKKSDREKTLSGLKAVSCQLSADSGWDEESLQKILESVVAENNLANGDVFWPVRVALSGAEKSPSPIELLLALSRGESLERIREAIQKLG